MAVTWLYLPLTFSRLGLRNFGVGSWAHTLKVYKVFTKVGQGPWLKRKRCLGPAGVINCTPLYALSFWVSLFPGVFGYNNIFLPFYTVHGVLTACILEWFTIPFFSESYFVRTLHYDPSSWMALHDGMVHSFIELCKPLCYNKAVIHEGEFYV